MDSGGKLEKGISKRPMENKGESARSSFRAEGTESCRKIAVTNSRGSAVGQRGGGTPVLQRNLKRDPRRARRNLSSSLSASCSQKHLLVLPTRQSSPWDAPSRTPRPHPRPAPPCPWAAPLAPSLEGAAPRGAKHLWLFLFSLLP